MLLSDGLHVLGDVDLPDLWLFDRQDGACILLFEALLENPHPCYLFTDLLIAPIGLSGLVCLLPLNLLN